MSPAAWWALAAIVGSFVASVGGALLAEYAIRRRERRQTAAILAGQQPPATPELDPIDEQVGIAAALLNPDSVEADAALLIRQTEAHLWRAAGQPPVIPGDGA